MTDGAFNSKTANCHWPRAETPVMAGGEVQQWIMGNMIPALRHIGTADTTQRIVSQFEDSYYLFDSIILMLSDDTGILYYDINREREWM